LAKKSKFVCKECGYETYKAAGKCFGCGTFGSLREESYFTGKEKETKSSKTISTNNKKAVYLHEVNEGFVEQGFSSGIGELDRVLGGQITEGSLVLLGGDPGNGKSTLLSKVSDNVSKSEKVFYASGEESEYQLKKRMQGRMKMSATNNNFKILFSRNLDEIETEALEYHPKLMILDSINTIGDPMVAGNPGDISQVRHCINRLMNLAKEHGITIFIIVQVTKNGDIKGPKELEHMVDTVLYLEGEKYSDLRLVRCRKNRFGSDMELGVFRMAEEGLIEVPNPSEYLLANRPEDSSGSGVVCISDTRPLLIEVQALVSTPVVPGTNPRRTAKGFSRNNLSILTAVLERKCNSRELSAKDIYVNVVGGMDVEEPGADLGVAMTIYSSNVNKVIDSSTVMIGEVGLAGEVRPVSRIEQLVREVHRVGFKQVIVPMGSFEQLKKLQTEDFLITPVRNLNDCIKVLF
jgi:DNA repair protein RadA/Sms